MSRRLAAVLAATLASTGALHAQTSPPARVARSNADSQDLLKLVAENCP